MGRLAGCHICLAICFAMLLFASALWETLPQGNVGGKGAAAVVPGVPAGPLPQVVQDPMEDGEGSKKDSYGACWLPSC